MDGAHAAATVILVTFADRIASLLRPMFPAHADAIRGEIVGTRMTTDRWNRLAHILASLHSVPGHALSQREHAVRNIALAAVTVMKKMAAASFGGRDPDGVREFALWYAGELGVRIDNTFAREIGQRGS